jgi:hypothetical protein
LGNILTLPSLLLLPPLAVAAAAAAAVRQLQSFGKNY